MLQLAQHQAAATSSQPAALLELCCLGAVSNQDANAWQEVAKQPTPVADTQQQMQWRLSSLQWPPHRCALLCSCCQSR